MKHPIQPLQQDKRGTLRFKENKIVQYLLENGPFDLNHLAVKDFPQEDREQFAQLIGYSLNGYADLSYVRDENYEAAHRMHHNTMSELEARLEVAEEMVAMLRDKLRNPMAELFGVHPDDLINQ